MTDPHYYDFNKPGVRRHPPKYGDPELKKQTSANMAIYRATQELCKNELSCLCIPSSETYYHDGSASDLPEIDYNTRYEVIDIDTLEATRKLVEAGFNPLVLNMANGDAPCGGDVSGNSQEEELFRRTSAHLSLSRSYYPLDPRECLYSPEVFILREVDNSIIPSSKERTRFAMISVAAINSPMLNHQSRAYARDADYQLMRDKIETIFQVGILHGHDSLVLGALGCGAFKNPPGQVAAIFHQMCESYGRFFKRICFSILVVDNKKENIEVFKTVLL